MAPERFTASSACRAWGLARFGPGLCASLSLLRSAQRLNDRLAGAKYLLEHLFRVIVRRELEHLRELAIQSGQIVSFSPGLPRLVEYPLGHVLQEGAQA